MEYVIGLEQMVPKKRAILAKNYLKDEDWYLPSDF